MGDTIAFQQMGFGIAVALLIDATIVRSVLVPATMKLLGERNWYLPAWLGWLPDVHVEGAERPPRARFGHAGRKPLSSEDPLAYPSKGGTVMSDASNESLEEARRYVRRKRIFYTVLGIWIALCLMWFTIDMLDDSSSSGSTGPCSAPASAWPSPQSCSWGSAGSSASIGNARRSRSSSTAEGTSLAVSRSHRADRDGHTVKTNSRRCVGWLLVAGGVVTLLFAALLSVYAWAWSSTEQSTIARALIWRVGRGRPGQIPGTRHTGWCSRESSSLRRRPGGHLPQRRTGRARRVPSRDGHPGVCCRPPRPPRVGAVLRLDSSEPADFVLRREVVCIDAGRDRDRRRTDRKHQRSGDGLPAELAARDRKFQEVTLRDLLTMSSGIRYREGGFPSFGDDTYTRTGVDLRDVALNRTQIEQPPGITWHYNNYHPLLLGWYSSAPRERPCPTSWRRCSGSRWEPRPTPPGTSTLRALVREDESGLNARAVDYARFGLAFLHNGEWNGRRIVSEDWVRAATGADTDSGPASYHGYGYFWWTDADRPGRFYAMGKYGQYIYVAPTRMRWSFASVATGGSAATTGWVPYGTSRTVEVGRDRPSREPQNRVSSSQENGRGASGNGWFIGDVRRTDHGQPDLLGDRFPRRLHRGRGWEVRLGRARRGGSLVYQRPRAAGRRICSAAGCTRCWRTGTIRRLSTSSRPSCRSLRLSGKPGQGRLLQDTRDGADGKDADRARVRSRGGPATEIAVGSRSRRRRSDLAAQAIRAGWSTTTRCSSCRLSGSGQAGSAAMSASRLDAGRTPIPQWHRVSALPHPDAMMERAPNAVRQYSAGLRGIQGVSCAGSSPPSWPCSRSCSPARQEPSSTASLMGTGTRMSGRSWRRGVSDGRGRPAPER